MKLVLAEAVAMVVEAVAGTAPLVVGIEVGVLVDEGAANYLDAQAFRQP